MTVELHNPSCMKIFGKGYYNRIFVLNYVHLALRIISHLFIRFFIIGISSELQCIQTVVKTPFSFNTLYVFENVLRVTLFLGDTIFQIPIKYIRNILNHGNYA